MRLHDAPADGKAQTRFGKIAPLLPVLTVATGNFSEQKRQTLGRYASSLVGDRDDRLQLLLRRVHPDGGKLAQMAGGIGEMGAERVDAAPSVRHHLRQIRRDVDLNAVSVACVRAKGPRFVNRRARIRRLRGDRQRRPVGVK